MSVLSSWTPVWHALTLADSDRPWKDGASHNGLCWEYSSQATASVHLRIYCFGFLHRVLRDTRLFFILRSAKLGYSFFSELLLLQYAVISNAISTQRIATVVFCQRPHRSMRRRWAFGRLKWQFWKFQRFLYLGDKSACLESVGTKHNKNRIVGGALNFSQPGRRSVHSSFCSAVRCGRTTPVVLMCVVFR